MELKKAIECLVQATESAGVGTSNDEDANELFTAAETVQGSIALLQAAPKMSRAVSGFLGVLESLDCEIVSNLSEAGTDERIADALNELRKVDQLAGGAK